MAASPPTPGRIFISYRREETAYPAGWLYDRLANRFGASQVFKDVDSIAPGDDFVEVITSAVGSCDVLLALIGADWLTITDNNGRRQLDNALPALVGNLLWAATAVEAVPAKVFLSFFGATLGTLGTIPPSYDAVIGPVTGDVTKRINDLHDDMLNRMDVLIFPVLSRQGFAKFADLDPPHQLAFLWNELFRVASADGRFIEPTKAFVLANLQAADQDALDKLQLYQRAWNASLRPEGVDLEGPKYVFDQSVWAQYVSEPVWVWLGPVSPSLLVFRGPGDPNPSIRNQRAAAVLRLAIERRWPTPSA